MKKQRILGVLVIVLLIAGLVFFLGDKGIEEEGNGESEEAQVQEMVDELSAQLGVKIEEDVERASLRDVSGGGASGLATRNYDGEEFTHSILAALPETETGKFYEGWLVLGEEGDEEYSILNTGKLQQSKGGFLLEFSSDQDLSDYQKVIVTLEENDDSTPEDHILEGSF